MRLAAAALLLALQAPDVLTERLIEAVNAGRLPGRCRADAEGFFEEGRKVPWSALEPAVRFRLLEAIGLRGGDLLALAQWARSAGLAREAERVLSRYLQEDPEGRRDEVDRVLASWRGTPVPEGGYAYDPRFGWEDLEERTSRKARTRSAELCAAIAAAEDPAVLGRICAELGALRSAPGLPASVSAEIQSAGRTALRNVRDRLLRAALERAAGPATAAAVEKLRAELLRRRRAALQAIFDTNSYRGSEGQERVDRLVLKDYPGSLGELWESAGASLAAEDPILRDRLDTAREIHWKHLPALGLQPGAEDAAALEAALRALDDRVRGPGEDPKERELGAYNRRVDAYNAAFQDPDVSEEVKEHVRIVNDYREMMGLRRLYIDARLCRAARKHAAACNSAGRLWHVGPDADPQTRARREGFPDRVAENAGIKYGSPAEIWWKGWFRSADHHRIALGDSWTCMGYGYVGIAGVQVFSATALPRDFPK